MAFFKFRQHGPSESKAQTPSRTDSPAAGTPAETVETLRRRARHRLIGAVVLVALAVLGFPLLFDTEPRPVPMDAPITIPDRAGTAPLRMPDTAVSAAASLSDHEEVVPRGAAPAPAGESARAEPAAAAKPSVTARERDERAAEEARARREAQAREQQEQQAKARAQKEQEAQARAQKEQDAQAQARARQEAQANARREVEQKRQADQKREAEQKREAARARAALQGKSGATAATTSAADTGRFIVQIGAYAEAEAVREVRQKAERAGLKTYTQVVNTKEGPRTRVRVGPYGSRAEAEKAAGVLKKAGLPGGIYSL